MKKSIISMINKALKLSFILFVLIGLQVTAQKAPPEFSANIGGGINTYCFQPRIKGTSSIGYNGDVGVGFNGFISQQVGIYLGAEFGLFNVKSKVPELITVTPDLLDEINGLIYDLHTTLSNYSEIHKSLFVSIPVMFQFQTKQRQYWDWRKSKKAAFYAMAGAKVFFLFNNKYESQVETFYNAAYYTKLKNWAATQAFAGLGKFEEDYNAAGKLDFGVLWTIALETGIKWRIDDNIFVYTGVFFDCALNDPNKKDARQPYKKITAHEQLADLTLLNFSEKINLMTVGLKLRFAFTKK